jgi:hypothetical protein
MAGCGSAWRRGFCRNNPIFDRETRRWLRAPPRGNLTNMNATKLVAIVLIVAGLLGLVYGSFTYTKETHDAKIGPLEMSVKDKETVNIPVWAGVGAIVVGAGLLLAGRRGA